MRKYAGIVITEWSDGVCVHGDACPLMKASCLQGIPDTLVVPVHASGTGLGLRLLEVSDTRFETCEGKCLFSPAKLFLVNNSTESYNRHLKMIYLSCYRKNMS